MVVVKFRSEKSKVAAWSRAGRKVGKSFYPGGFKGKWVGKNSLSFPGYTMKQLKQLKIVR